MDFVPLTPLTAAGAMLVGGLSHAVEKSSFGKKQLSVSEREVNRGRLCGPKKGDRGYANITEVSMRSTQVYTVAE